MLKIHCNTREKNQVSIRLWSTQPIAHMCMASHMTEVRTYVNNRYSRDYAVTVALITDKHQLKYVHA
jgi:hypothetical protein